MEERQKVVLFGKKGCSLCEGWKRKLEHLEIPYLYYDVETVDGLTEMAYHNLARVPALIIGKKRIEEANPADFKSEDLLQLINEK